MPHSAAIPAGLTEAFQVERIRLGAALVLVAEPTDGRWRLVGSSSSDPSLYADPIRLCVGPVADFPAPRAAPVPAAVCAVLGRRPGHVWLSGGGSAPGLLAAAYWTSEPTASLDDLEAFRTRACAAVSEAPRPVRDEAEADLFARIVDRLPVGLVYFDDGATGMAVNRNARRLLDLPPADLTPRAAAEWLEGLGIPVQDPENLDGGSRGFDDIVIKERRYAVSAIPIEAPWGRGVAWRMEDVTDWRRTQTRLDEAKRALLLSSVSGGIGHEFNNLLSRVICLAEEIQDETDLQAISNAAESLIVTAEQGAVVVRRLMTYAGSTLTDVQAVDLRAALEAWRDACPDDDLTVDLPDPSATILTDPVLLRASLDELRKNARQAGATRVAVSCKIEPGEPIAVIVSDNGSGMDAMTVARAADPFFTTRAVGEGVGLGLSMVKGMLRQSGGKLQIVSQPGKGATVTLFLPAPRRLFAASDA